MNLLTRLLRRARIKMFPTVVEDRISRLNPHECAECLVAAASYCYGLRANGEMGRELSLAIVDPGGLTPGNAEAIYFNLEDLYTAAAQAGVGASEERAMSERLGASVGADYRRTVDRMTQAQVTGYAILMLRLLAHLRRVPENTLTAIRARLIAGVPEVDAAVNAVATMMTALPGGVGAAWTRETVDYHRQVAKTLAQAI